MQNFLNKLKEKIYEYQDKKIIEKIKKASNIQELNSLIYCYIGSYLKGNFKSPIHFDKTLLEIFKLLDNSHMFDKFKYGDSEGKYRGDWAENPTIFLMSLEQDKNKFDLFKYLKSNIPINILNTRLIIFSANPDIVDDFLNSLKDKKMKKEILEIIYNEKTIKTKTLITIMQDMTSEERKNFIDKHNLSNKEIVSLYNAFDDDFFIKDYYSSIENYFSENSYDPNEFRISKSNKAQEILNLFASKMHSSNICTCINICEKELISQGKEYDKNLVEKYSDYMVTMNQLVSLALEQNEEKIGWIVKKYANKITENSLKYGFIIYNQVSLQKTNSEKNESDPHYLYNLAKIYYETRMKDKTFEPMSIRSIAVELPILDRLKFIKKYRNAIFKNNHLENIEKLDIGIDIVKNKENLNLEEVLIQYRNIISEEDIVYIIEQMPEQERIKLIKDCALSKESIDKIIEYTISEKGNCSTLEKIKFSEDLKFAVYEKNATNSINNADIEPTENRNHFPKMTDR